MMIVMGPSFEVINNTAFQPYLENRISLQDFYESVGTFKGFHDYSNSSIRY